MITVTAWVAALPSLQGVDGLLVTAYAAAGSGRKRLGASITANGGNVTFESDHVPDPGPGRDRSWDLTVTVEAVEHGAGAAEESSTLLATETREDATSLEKFRILIPEARLAEAGILLSTPKSVGDVIAAGRAAREDRQRFDDERAHRLGEHLKRLKASRDATEDGFRGFVGRLSAVPAERREAGRFGYLPPDADVVAENLRAMREAIAGPLSEARATNTAVLDDAVLDDLRDRFGPSLQAVPASEIEHQAWPWRPHHSGRLVGRPSWKRCGGPPADDCVKLLEGEPVDEPPEPPPPAPIPPGETFPNGGADVATLVHVQSDAATSPETPVAMATRANIDDVQDDIDVFMLRSGPADGPALFDFHQLQIAFQPVWQELFDADYLDTVEALYNTIAEAGVDPNDYLVADGDGVKLKVPPKKKGAVADSPPPSVMRAFFISDREWDELVRLSLSEDILTLAQWTTGEVPSEEEKKFDEQAKLFAELKKLLPSIVTPPIPSKTDIRRRFRRQGEQIIDNIRARLAAPRDFDQFHELLSSLEKAQKAPYRFNVYAANKYKRSINFGVVVTYRQRWEPVAYQVGKLLRTIPLAPKEVRKFTTRTVMRTSRSEKEVTNNQQSRRTESSDIWRVESEIVAKAMAKTNFQLSAEGGFSIGIAHASGATQAGQEKAQESQEVKRQFREAVFKAAQEFKQEHSVEVESSESFEATKEETGEISNPNEEIPVTYLFYQLQRRYRVAEEIHSVIPVVLVAQEFPRPSDIDEDWIVRHDWILRRTLLDDTFQPALTYLSSKVVGDEVALRELYVNLEQHRRLVEDLKDDLIAIRGAVDKRYAALERAIARHADAVEEDETSGGIIPMPVGFLVDGSDVSLEATRLREEAARDGLERAAKEEKEIQARLDREVTALASLSESYTRQLSEHLNRKAQIARLSLHIKENIFYYMQAIWSHEPPDQRFFRLHDVEVPRLEGTKTYSIESDPDAIPMPPDWKKPQKLVLQSELDAENLQFDALGSVADLDDLLGFKGNLMIFPMRKGNDLTDFMMMPYFDPVAEIADPDPLGNWTLHDFVEYVCCLKKERPAEHFEKLLPGLSEAYRQLKQRGAGDEEIVVPTESLYIEALPGTRPVLEDFKLLHRAVDVKKALADVRAVELENVRLAARLLVGEHEDPTIEKKVLIDGGAPIVVPSDDA